MMSGVPPQTNRSADPSPAAEALALDSERLAAYLAGELSSDDARKVEELLAGDPTARRELQLLERAWQALDELPRAVATERFVGRTLALAVAAVQPAPRPAWRRWSLPALAWLLCGLGVFGIARRQGDTNRQLLRDLPLLEHLDAYRKIDSVEFLRALQDAGLFVDGDNAAS